LHGGQPTCSVQQVRHVLARLRNCWGRRRRLLARPRTAPERPRKRSLKAPLLAAPREWHAFVDDRQTRVTKRFAHQVENAALDHDDPLRIEPANSPHEPRYLRRERSTVHRIWLQVDEEYAPVSQPPQQLSLVRPRWLDLEDRPRDIPEQRVLPRHVLEVEVALQGSGRRFRDQQELDHVGPILQRRPLAAAPSLALDVRIVPIRVRARRRRPASPRRCALITTGLGRIRCARTMRSSFRCDFSCGHVRERAFPDVSGRPQRASAGLRTSGSGRAPDVGRSLCVPCGDPAAAGRALPQSARRGSSALSIGGPPRACVRGCRRACAMRPHASALRLLVPQAAVGERTVVTVGLLEVGPRPRSSPSRARRATSAGSPPRSSTDRRPPRRAPERCARCAASWCRSCLGLASASQAQHQPGARQQQAGAGAGDHRQDLLQRHASHVSDHVLLEPRCEAAASESAASKTVALSYSSWRFHHW